MHLKIYFICHSGSTFPTILDTLLWMYSNLSRSFLKCRHRAHVYIPGENEDNLFLIQDIQLIRTWGDISFWGHWPPSNLAWFRSVPGFTDLFEGKGIRMPALRESLCVWGERPLITSCMKYSCLISPSRDVILDLSSRPRQSWPNIQETLTFLIIIPFPSRMPSLAPLSQVTAGKITGWRNKNTPALFT